MRSVRLGLALLLTTAAVVLVHPSPSLAADPGLTISVVAQQDGGDVNTSTVGESVDLVATVSPPAPDLAVVFTSDRGWRSDVQLTDDDGQAYFTYTNAVVGSETVTAAIVAAGCEDVAPTQVDHEWTFDPLPPPSGGSVAESISISQDLSDSIFGEDYTFEIVIGEAAVETEPGWVYTLTLTVDRVFAEEVTVTKAGTYRLSGSPPAADTATVAADFVGESFDASSRQYVTLEHEWWEPELRLTPDRDSAATTGSTATIQATLSHAGAAVAGQDVVVTAAPRAIGGTAVTRTLTTDAGGHTTFTWGRDDEGTDDVDATWSGGSATVNTRPFPWRWVDELVDDYAITLAQAAPTQGRLGTTAALTAEVIRVDDGEPSDPVADVDVRFSGAGTPSTLQVTDDSGTATSSVTAQQPGVRQLVASIEIAGCTVLTSDPVEHEWWLPDLTLVPVSATSRVNEPAAVTARLMHGSAALDGVPLEFTRRNGSGTLLDTFTTTTEPDGTALYGWTSATAGIDTVTVTEIAVPQPQSATATHEWTPVITTPPTSPTPSTPAPTTPTPTTPPPVTSPPVISPPPPPTTDPPTEPSVDENTPSSPSVSPTATVTESQSERPTPTPEPGGFDPPAETGQTGGELKLSGRGCPAGSTVSLTLAGLALGSTTADENGAYELQVPAPDLPLGRHPLQARCGDTVIDGNLDLSSSASGNGQVAGAGATTGAVLLFFLLLGNTVLGGLRARL